MISFRLNQTTENNRSLFIQKSYSNKSPNKTHSFRDWKYTLNVQIQRIYLNIMGIYKMKTKYYWIRYLNVIAIWKKSLKRHQRSETKLTRRTWPYTWFKMKRIKWILLSYQQECKNASRIFMRRKRIINLVEKLKNWPKYAKFSLQKMKGKLFRTKICINCTKKSLQLTKLLISLLRSRVKGNQLVMGKWWIAFWTKWKSLTTVKKY